MAMNSQRRSLVRTIADHPEASAQDALLLSSIMIVGVLLALEFNLFSFAEQLTDHQRRITLAEAIALTILLAACIIAFVIRRWRDERRHLARSAVTRSEFRDLQLQALEDPLTGLPNRRALLSALTAATASPDFDKLKLALFLLDLNDFKRVNDTRGHVAGDHVLKTVANRFRNAVRPNDLLARLGGDEFALLSYDVDRDTAEAIGLRLLAALDRAIVVGNQSCNISASLGVALTPEGGTTTEEILHNADLAMYRAKGARPPSLVFFDAISPRQVGTA
jgi:diguanylate cyclase (GGDEF)-like protein